MVVNFKLRKSILILVPWVVIIIALGYFILINTVFAEQRLTPNLAQVLGLTDEQDVNNLEFSVDIDGYKYNFYLHQIAFPDWQQRLIRFGRGADFLQVIKQGIAAASGSYELWRVIIDEERLVYALPVVPASKGEFVRLEQSGWLTGCSKNSYDLQLDTPKLKTLITSALNNRISGGEAKIVTKWQEVSANPQIRELFAACGKYKEGLERIHTQFKDLVGDRSSIEYIFGYQYSQAQWAIRRTEPLVQILEGYKSKTYVAANDGEYVDQGNLIHLLKPYVVGRELVVADSVKAISDWTSNINAELRLVFREITPPVVSLGKQILDFTKLVSKGATRIDLIRNGVFNNRADFVVYGLEGIQDTVVMPGQQFSYIDTANPDRGRFIKNGRPVGNGFCMATTTIFRAALEGGFPITERYQHGYNFSSYAWSENNKYPYNLVDAAYYTNPEIDFKFINNTAYPILIKATAKRESDGYQYNYIHIYTSSLAPTREVSLHNWQITSDRGQGLYGQRISGFFERKVIENGEVILQDKYSSSYR